MRNFCYIYFRFKNLDGRPPLIDPKLYTNAAWYKRFKMRNLGIGGLNALLWTLLLYQFSLFLLTKYKVYLYSSLYLFFNSINNLSISGILPEYLLTEYPKANEITWLIAWISLGIFYMAFCRTFARTNIHLKTWDKILKTFSRLLICSLVSVIISLFFTFRLDIFLQINFIIGIGLITFMPFFAIAVLRKKIKGTLLFSIGVLQISVFIFISYFHTLQNPTSVVSNILDLITIAIEGILFTVALALRLKVLEEEKNEAQQNQIEFITHQKETLEKKVKERTQELEEKNEEIQTYHQEMLVQNEWLENQQEEIKNQQEALNQKNKVLLQQNTLISQSIQSAQTIQSAILPNKQLLQQLLGEHFMIYRPKDVVSGDFYWLQQVDEQIFLAIVDCTGHGVPGAFMSMIGNTLLNKIILVQEVHSPAEIFNRLHNEIALQLQQEEVHHIYGMEMTLLSWQPSQTETQEFVFCGAKSPLMYVLPDGEELQTLSGDRRSIGGYQPENVFFSDQILTLPKGSMIYLGSDGFQDQHNPKRKKIVKRNLQGFIQQQAQLPINVQKQQLESFLDNHQQEASQRDDIMLLGFRV